MEKPTGVIQKIIESLQQINTLDVYSPIEKDIILHNLRAAYMIFLNIPEDKESTENRVEKLFIPKKAEEENVEAENFPPEEEIIEEQAIEVEIIEEQTIEVEVIEEQIIEEQIIEFEEQVVEIVEEQPQEEIIEHSQVVEEIEVVEEVIEIIETKTEIIEEISVEVEVIVEQPLVTEPLKQTFQDDILEFIPDAQPKPTSLFDEALKSEKKSLNDLLTEKKEDHSLSNKFQHSSIPDLTKAIAINEKFSFIRELFRNSGVDFSDAIQKLNDCENIDAAFALMEEFKHQYLWDTTSSTYLSLCDLVRRRFI